MRHALDRVFDPESIAVIGASDDVRKWGNFLVVSLLGGGFDGELYLVNPRGELVLGRTTHRSAAQIGHPIDLAVIAVPAERSRDAVRDALDAGAKGILIVAAGFAETGPDGARLQSLIVDDVKTAGARLVGPNCLGMFSSTSKTNLTPFAVAPGPLALISQSGSVALEVLLLARQHDIGFSHFITCGNQADVSINECLEFVSQQPATEVVMIYLEGTSNGRDLVRQISETSVAKPVIVLKAGVTSAGARAALSHTGSLAQGPHLWRSVLAQSNAINVESPFDLITVANAMVRMPRARGRRVAIISDGGGHATMASDAAETVGLSVGELSSAVITKLDAVLPSRVGRRNPIDLAGAAEGELWSMVEAARILLESDDVDALWIVGILGGNFEVSPNAVELENQVARALVDLPRQSGKPLFVHSIYSNSRSVSIATLREGGIPVTDRMRAGALAVASLAPRVGRGRVAPLPTNESGVDQPAGQLPPEDAKSLLESAGVRVVETISVRSGEEAVTAAEKVGYPVVLKGHALHVIHKSDIGAVVLGCYDAESVRTAFKKVTAAAKLADPLDTDAHATVSRMVSGIEAIAGGFRDSSFGPVIMFGLGGIHAETFGDVAFRLAPVDETQARSMIDELKAFPILSGARGQVGANLEACASAVAALSRLMAREPRIAELDLNPLMLGADAIAVDVRVIVGP
jgi:acyl-CoA synthetase (NDP forming)